MKLAPLSAFLLMALVVRAQGPASEILKTEVPPRPGEICIGCNRPIDASDKTYLVEGQRVPVHRADCDNALRSAPMRFLASLKPRGGLFGGEMSSRSTISDAWLLAGLYVLLGLGFAAVSAHRALDHGRSPYFWFFVGLIFTAPGYLALLMRPSARQDVPAGLVKIPVTASPQPCPMCGTTNHPSATRCLGCNATLRPAALSEASRLKSTLN